MLKSVFKQLGLAIMITGLIVLLAKGLSLNPRELELKHVGEPLPILSLPILEDEKSLITLDDLPNEPFILHAWATWCGVCRQEHSTLFKLKQRGVILVGLNYKDNIDYAKSWLNSQGSPFSMNVIDQDGYYGLKLGLYGTPETFVIDDMGTIRYRHTGSLEGEKDINALVKAIEALNQERTG